MVAEPQLKKAQKPLKTKVTLPGVSIKEMLKDKQTEDENDNRSHLPKDEFTIEDVQKLWEELLKNLETSNDTHIVGAIKTTDIQLTKPSEITFIFHSNASKAEFDRIKRDWFATVEKSLNNYHIDFKQKVEVTATNKPNIRTAEDIYEDMKSKNPLLEKLKKDFGLDFYA